MYRFRQTLVRATQERPIGNARRIVKNVLTTLLILLAAAGVSLLMQWTDVGDNYVSMIFLLAVAMVSWATDGFEYGVAASIIGVLAVNFIFTKPYFQFCLSVSGYPLTFFSMLVIALIIGTMTSQLKAQDEQRFRAQVERMRANLLRAVSHDLRTPLTCISGAASMMLEQPDMPQDKREKLLGEIIDDAQWMVRMVENLLSITRINGQPSALHKTCEAAEEVVSEAVRKFRKRFSGIPVDIVLPDELLLAPMDPILIEQVLANLLENAATHSRTATRIRLTLCVKGDWAQFEVQDDGDGVDPRRLPDIFDSAASQASDGSRGMGIGLSVCKAIILAHGGEIEAENCPEGGACFRFRLPMKEEEHESGDERADR